MVACGARDGETAPELRTVRIATSGDYPPFSLWAPGAATPEGFEPDLLATWAAATGRRIEWMQFRWPDLTDDVASARFDLAAGGITVRSDRALVGTFGVPLAESGAVALVPAGSGLDLAALDSPAHRIGVNRGGHLERVTAARFPRARVRPTSPNAAVPGLLETGEVDAVVTDTREAPLWLEAHPDWRMLGPFTRDRKAVLASPGREALLAELDVWLLDRPGSDVLDAMRQLHLGDDPRAHALADVDALLAAMDDRLALMPDVARFKRRAGVAVEAPEREQHVLEAGFAAVVAASQRMRRPPPPRHVVEAFYRAQIEAAKEIQRGVLASPVEPPVAAIPDLDGELRPALIRIGDRMAWLIVRMRGTSTHDLAARVEAALPRHGLAPATLAEITRATRALATAEPGATDPAERAPSGPGAVDQ